MKTYIRLIQVVLALCYFFSGIAFSGKPVFLITPIQKAPNIIFLGQKASAIYQVTNNTPYTLHSNGMLTLPRGVVQTGGSCTMPTFNLASGASCTVNLEITGDELRGDLRGGPVVCNTLNNRIYCSRPSSGDELNVVVQMAAMISVNPSVLNMLVGGPGLITVTNLSTTMTINGLQAVIPPGSGLSIDTANSTCTIGGTLAPSSSCTIVFQATSPGTSVIMIQAENIVSSEVTINVSPSTRLSVPVKAAIPVNDPAGVTITVTNLTSTPATNVTADLSATGWVGVSSSTCAVIPANGTCDLTITSNTVTPYIAQLGIVITGTNVISPPTIALAFSISDYLVFATTGPSPGTAKVIFSGDNSEGIVWDSSSDCPDPGDNCILTNATSLTDGSDNTDTIIAALTGQPGVTSMNYAAGLCFSITSDNTSPSFPNGTWYLPAICEFGPSGQAANCPPGLANVSSNLFFNTNINFGDFLVLNYWSSTEVTANSAIYQFLQPDATQAALFKAASFAVRCVRTLSY